VHVRDRIWPHVATYARPRACAPLPREFPRTDSALSSHVPFQYLAEVVAKVRDFLPLVRAERFIAIEVACEEALLEELQVGQRVEFGVGLLQYIIHRIDLTLESGRRDVLHGLRRLAHHPRVLFRRTQSALALVGAEWTRRRRLLGSAGMILEVSRVEWQAYRASERASGVNVRGKESGSAQWRLVIDSWAQVGIALQQHSICRHPI
jgi:hypothetical protein